MSSQPNERIYSMAKFVPGTLFDGYMQSKVEILNIVLGMASKSLIEELEAANFDFSKGLVLHVEALPIPFGRRVDGE